MTRYPIARLAVAALLFAAPSMALAQSATTGAIAGTAKDTTGAVLPGVSPVQGAIAGAVLGGVLGAVVRGRQYYRDTRGYCYYVDQYGQPHYSYDIRC